MPAASSGAPGVIEAQQVQVQVDTPAEKRSPPQRQLTDQQLAEREASAARRKAASAKLKAERAAVSVGPR